MPRILIVGGYGAFGARVAERLARDPDIDVVIAGRSAAKAHELAERLASTNGRNIAHAVLDVTRATADGLRDVHADVVVNASGPFQAQDYLLARACIAAGIHYVDLADARAFVTGISSLDAEAKAAGVLVVSGASSVPGLSSAVVDHYTASFSELTEVSHGISPGNSFDPGIATTRSIVGGVGQPVSMRVHGQIETTYVWQTLQRHRFPGIGPRWMSACDVPDLELFPQRYPSLHTVRFTAGLEVGAFHIGLWALSWLVRLGIVRHPERIAGALLATKRHLSYLGSDRGGMFVSMAGVGHDGRPALIDWHLEAISGHGPYIPAIPAVVVARKLARGELGVRGAMPCLGLCTLAEFLDEVADLDIRASDSTTPLYRRVLGASYDRLPESVRRLHDIGRGAVWRGEADIDRGTSLMARLGALLTRLPPAGRKVPLTVSFRPDECDEIWVRDFAGHVFRSRQWESSGRLGERLGPVELAFDALPDEGGLALKPRSMRVLGVLVPGFLLPVTQARESEEDGKFRFSVDVRLPDGSPLVHYRGWLEPAPDADS